MDPLKPLKRPAPVDLHVCIICQETKHDVLFDATSQGLTSVNVATTARRKICDIRYRDTIERLEFVFRDDPEPRLVWHKSCYADYTHKGKIERLQKRCEASAFASKSDVPQTRHPSLRSKTKPMNWKLCIFCQDNKTKHNLCQITTENMSNQILSSAKYIEIICVRVAGVNDLIAAEGCYHPNCLKKFMRDTSKATTESQKFDLPMIWLGQELKQSAKKGHVIELDKVWVRYQEIAHELGKEIPRSFISRLSTFKQKIAEHVKNDYDFIVLRDQPAPDRQTILVPVMFSHIPYSQWTCNDDETEELANIPLFQSEDSEHFLPMINVALKLRSDILSQPAYKGVDVTEELAIDCVPTSVYMFLRLLLGGQSLLDADPDEDIDEDKEELCKRSRVLSIAQDLVFSVSGGKKLTPKHIGLGATLHQATRSKQLVDLFHRAGHVISYRDILRIDTSLATSTLEKMDPTTGAVIPPNLVPRRFVHFSVDNIDINDSTLDGKNTFHGTQIAAWQRGPAPDNLLKNLVPSKQSTLTVPKVLETVTPVNIVKNTTEPNLGEVKAEWFKSPEIEPQCAIDAKAKDLAFMFIRFHEETKSSWTPFNEEHSQINPEQTTVGYIPIIAAPAHEIDTLNTVSQRLLHISAAMEQNYTVVTVDQALFPILMKLKWSLPHFKDTLIPRLGGLHIGMNFLKVIGQYTEDIGLETVWVESGILGPLSAKRALNGTSYAKGVRAHKLTLQSLWQILILQFLTTLQESNTVLKEELVKMAQSDEPDQYESLVTHLASASFRNCLDDFISSKCEDVNFLYWWNYMKMVHTLLLFIRAQRDGLWELHLYAFREMLPYFHHYDHINYARWGCVYLATMNQLPEEVKEEFDKGNFVVKESNRRFNQVDPDHSLEWLNAVGKKGGGIIGITKTNSALARWALSYNQRATISRNTRTLFMVDHYDEMTHNESNPKRILRDNTDENNIECVLRRFKVLEQNISTQCLQNIATKDLATADIQDSLIRAQTLGQSQLDTFVKERMLDHNEDGKKLKLSDPLKKSKAKTFKALYEVKMACTNKEVILKADRNILQRLITAYNAGRNVDLYSILSHELMPVPVSLANTNGTLRSGNKAILADVLINGIFCPPDLVVHRNSCLIIDGQALVLTLGKPAGVVTFEELADSFLNLVIHMGRHFSRIDVIFDRYYDKSIKAGTRDRRSKHVIPVRRMIENGSVPVPINFSEFLANLENKKDLSRFLSNHLITHFPEDKTIVVSGGFLIENDVQTNNTDLPVQMLQAYHEEADTRIVLHCLQCDADSIVVSACDTDVLVLLVALFHKIDCTNLWVRAGTAKQRKYIPVHEIRQQFSFTDSVFECLLPFHSITGCDTVSHIAGISKKKAWKTFISDPELLQHLGIDELKEDTIHKAEKFICKLYDAPNARSCDEVRVKMFNKGRNAQALPPSTDAVKLHIQRAHYQAMVWRQSVIPKPVLPSPATMGWKIVDGQLIPNLLTLPPIPQACKDIVSCGCKGGCIYVNCSCRKSKLVCTAACKCAEDGNKECMNVQE